MGDTVYVRAYPGGNAQWIPATILKRTGPVSYLVQVDDCTVFRRHIDQIHQRWVDTSDVQQPPAPVPSKVVVPPPVCSTPTPMIVPVGSRSEPELPPSVPKFHATESLPCSPASSSTVAESSPSPVKTQRFPTRSRKAPQRLTYTSFKEERV